MRFSLATLTAPVPLDEFKTKFWPHRHAVSSGPLERLGELADIPELESPEALMKGYRCPVEAWPPRGQPSMPPFNPTLTQLPIFYRAGFTLYFHRVEVAVPALKPLVRTLEEDLGLRKGEIYCEAFASAQGSGAHLHFDPNVGFNVLLRGRKRWKVAENRHVKHPHQGFVLDRDFFKRGNAQDMAAYMKEPFPDTIAESEKTEFVATPGTAVFIPQGMWHETHAEEPSLGLTFSLSSRRWSLLMAREMDEQLRLRDRWRELAAGISGTDAREKLVVLLEDLKTWTSGLDADTLLAKWQDDEHYFRRGQTFEAEL